MVAVADTSVLIEYVNGREAGAVEEALTNDQLILPPLVISELVTGGIGIEEGMRIADVLRFARMHDTTLRHWIAVGDLRRDLGRHGLKVTPFRTRTLRNARSISTLLSSRETRSFASSPNTSHSVSHDFSQV